MKTLTMLATVALFGLALANPVAADHCNGNITAVEVGSETLYIDDRADDPNAPPGSGLIFGPGGTWLYLESNNVDGLQTGGSTGIPGGDDSCSHANPDTIIF